jgi:3-keto-5-aminohexanoate cleavage enzyme
MASPACGPARRSSTCTRTTSPTSTNCTPGFVYLNLDGHIRTGLRIVAEHGLRPAYACYEPGFTRLRATLAAAQEGLLTPVYRFMFSDGFRFWLPA